MTAGPYVIEHGDVWYREAKPGRLSTGLRHVCRASEEMAIAHDGEMLLKVGSADAVAQWELLNRAKFTAVNEAMQAMGHGPTEVVVVNLPVCPDVIEEINNCVAISGRVQRLDESLARIGEANPDLFTRPIYPK